MNFYTERWRHLYEEALAFASEAHKGQFRWDRKTPYIEHPKAVASKFEGQAVVAVIALLHDTVEDCDVTIEEIRNKFGIVVAENVDALTKRDGESYVRYLKRVKKLPLATRVKIEDIKHNLSTMGEKKSKQRVDKYQVAIAYLEA